MDLTPTDEQRELVALAHRILSDAAGPEVFQRRDREAVATFDRALWTSLAEAGLVGVAVPEDQGGLGFGFLESCLILEQVGRTTAPVPALAVLGVAVPVIVRFGTAAQQAELLPSMSAGTRIAVPAVAELAGDPYVPATAATADGGGWVLHGEKTGVLAGTEADTLLVTATVEGLGPRVFVVPTDGAGLEISPQPTVTGEVDALVRFDGTPATLLGESAADDSVASVVRHATVAMCAVVAGTTGGAVDLTAEYVKTRQAFGRPIATFQAVGQRLADAFTAAWAIRLTALEAAWCLADGRSADLPVLTAKYYAAASGHEVTRATHHLHGGFGMDRDYQLHRYSTYGKRLELTLGGAGEQIERLGDLIAAQPVAS